MRPRQRTMHMVGNAHIDPVWLWQWPEGYQEVRATFQSAIDRMDEYPDFVFTCDSVLYLKWVEESDPQLFEAIRKRVAEGRWKVVGGWWIEPDCNIPGGESFVRQALYAQRYLQERFGIVATVGCNVDPFGHNAMLPQLLRKSRIDSYTFLRPGPHELTLPGQHFWWESADGSRVLAYRIPHEYCTPGSDIGNHIDKSLAVMPPDEPELMIFYGVGNHGGGPTKANLDSIRRLDELGGLPRLPLSHPQAFFDAVRDRADIPVHAGELQHHGVGCYSAHSGVKRWNRRAENLLQRAEKWSAVARVVAGIPYPRAELTEAWQLVLFNQFHDILAGTSIAPAYEDSRDQYGHASSIAATAFNRAVQSISRLIDIPAEADMYPLVVFNPHPWKLTEDVEFEFTGFPGNAPARMVDDEGADVPVQRTRSYATMAGSRRRLAFRAEVPPLGYRVYRVLPGESSPGSAPVRATDAVLENDHLLVEVDPSTGWLRRLYDKDNGVELLPEAPGPHAVVVDDPSDTWGHRIDSYDKEIGSFRCTRVRLVEHGPVRAVLRVESEFGDSTLAEELVLSAGARHLEVRTVVDWHEKLRLLKLRFPTAIDTASATFEIPYGHIERSADGAEESAQAWVDVSGTLADGRRAGLSVLNDSKYGHDARGGTIGMTALRSPAYAWHEPMGLAEDGVYEYLDQGRQEFRYCLVPHDGDWRADGTVRLAAQLNQSAFPLLETYHPGPLPSRSAFVEVAADSVVVSVVKGDEDDSDALVVRAVETAGQAVRTTIDLPLLSRSVEADFGPSEIKTFRVPLDPEKPVVETDLLEWPVGEPVGTAPAAVDGAADRAGTPAGKAVG
ncbi:MULTISPECIES: alpha-mannosidase [Streptomyces]|uniref:Glycoside hydrolase family 38 C-terminal domain-containing protein n=1 Tax=Streptomyces flaveolus TaxID=67297 RepID=A0ABV3APA0_9ACTN|nr:MULTISPECIES: alpha-mannosidase [Streptomyces]